jgi:hypothetical protein
MKQISRPATAAEIIEIVGQLDDAVLMRILETQAARAEVLEAFTWVSADDQIGTELEHGPRGVVARVYDILKREEPEPDERR